MTTPRTNVGQLDSRQTTSSLFDVDEITRTALYDEAGKFLVVFDATVEEVGTFTSQFSKNPTERGATITDHQIIDPVVVSLSIVISNNPIEQFTLEDFATKFAQVGAGLTAGLVGYGLASEDQVVVNQATGEVQFIEGNYVVSQNRGAAIGDFLATLAMDQGDSAGRRDQIAFETLRNAQVNGTRLLIVTPFRSYIDMGLKDITVRKNSETMNSLTADLVFEERPVFTTAQSTLEPKGKTDEINGKATKKVSAGKVAAKPANVNQVEKAKNSSTAYDIAKLIKVID